MVVRTEKRLSVRFMVPVLVAGVVAGLTGCAVDPPPPPPGPPEVLRVGIGEPGSLLPADATEPDQLQVLAAVFTPLVGFDAQGEPYPLAAAEITPDPTATEWTVTLRPGFTFHDGEPVTASSYLRAWNEAAYRPHGRAGSYLLADIAGFDAVHPTGDADPTSRALAGLAAVNDLTFTVRLSEARRDFPGRLGAPVFYPLPASAFDHRGELYAGYQRRPVGNGPFQLLAEEVPGGGLAAQRYPGYAADPARVERIEFVHHTDPVAAYQRLLTGDLDVLPQIPAAHLPGAEADLAPGYLRRPAGSTQFLAVADHAPGLADPTIRRAISMAIDREELVRTGFRGGGAARSFTTPSLPGARPDSCGQACEFDPESAREQYRSAGGPERLTITYNQDGDHARWVEATCEQLRAHLAVTCDPDPEPRFEDLVDRLARADEIGLFRLGWSADYPSLGAFLGPLYATGGGANYHGFSDPEFDRLLTAGASAGSPAEAIDAWQQAEDRLAAALPVIPLRYAEHHTGHSARVTDVALDPYHRLDFTRIRFLPTPA